MQLAHLVDLHDIPACCVVNSDQTGVHMVHPADRQWAEKGAQDVSANGYGEKRQFTVTAASSADGDNLGLQV